MFVTSVVMVRVTVNKVRANVGTVTLAAVLSCAKLASPSPPAFPGVVGARVGGESGVVAVESRSLSPIGSMRVDDPEASLSKDLSLLSLGVTVGGEPVIEEVEETLLLGVFKE